MPVSTFWTAEEKIPVQQEKVSIPSDNGLSHNDGQRIIFTVPDEIEYINPVNTLLEIDFKINFPGTGVAPSIDPGVADWAPTRLQLDPAMGGNVLIRHIRLYGNTAEMPLLEEVADCNVLASVRYDYNTNDNLKKKRALTEGSSMYTPIVRNGWANPQAEGCNAQNNAYCKANLTGNTGIFGNTGSDTGFKTAKLLLPLHQSGIFSSDVVFPNKLVGGLRIELELQSADRCLKQLDSTLVNRNRGCNPMFHSVDGLDDPAAGAWTALVGSATDTFYVTRENGMTDVDKLPFCVGERISIKDIDSTAIAGFQVWRENGGATLIREPTIASIALAPTAAGRAFPLIQITLTEPSWPSVTIPAASLAATPGAYNSKNILYSTSLGAGTSAAGGVNKIAMVFQPTYTVSNAKLLVEKVQMPAAYTSKMITAMKSGGTINYDFLSFTNYKYSQLKEDRVANIRIPVMNSRAKGVICCACDQTVYTTQENILGGNQCEDVGGVAATFTYEEENVGNDLSNVANFSVSSGLRSMADQLSAYQFFYNGRLNPSRKVNYTKISNRVSIAQQPIVENEKCLAVCGIPPDSFASFRTNAFVGRAVGLQQGVSDLSQTDFNLQTEYQELTAPSKNKLWQIYIGHLRRLQIRGDSIKVEV